MRIWLWKVTVFLLSIFLFFNWTPFPPFFTLANPSSLNTNTRTVLPNGNSKTKSNSSPSSSSSSSSPPVSGDTLYKEAHSMLKELDHTYPHLHHLGHRYFDSMLQLYHASDQGQVKWFYQLPFLHWELPIPFLNFLPSRFTHSETPKKDLALYQTKVQQAVQLLTQAWDQFHQVEAGALLANMYVYGNFSVRPQPKKAFLIYSELAKHPHPSHPEIMDEAHYFLGFFYATNYGHLFNSSFSLTPSPSSSDLVLNTTQQHRAHLHFQLAAAYGRHTLAEMTMGYRYTSGIGCAASCEKSLPYFYRVASKVMHHYWSGPPGGHALPNSNNLRLYLEEGGAYGPGSLSGKSAKSESAITEEDAFEYYKYLADNGDIESQYVLGISFYLGTETVPRHYLRSLRYLSMAANALLEGNEPRHHQLLSAKAAGLIGRMYLRGEGVPTNNGTAQRWFAKGAKYQDPQSLTYLSIFVLDRYQASPDSVPKDEIQKALDQLHLAVKHDFADAQSYLGRFYFGLGKYVEATRYLSYASRHGNLPAMYLLAEIYDRGLGVQKNCGVANTFYRHVAEKGFEWFYPHLETAYHVWQDVPTNRALSMLLYLIAAERGSEVAQCNIAWLVDQISFPYSHATPKKQAKDHPETKEKDEQQGTQEQEATYFIPKGTSLVQWNRAGNQENGFARLKVGDAYYFGRSVPQHYAMAVNYYSAAAEFEQNAIAMWNLGYMYQHGLGVPKDYHLAKRYYDRSLQVNPEGWLPVSISLFYLHLTHLKEYALLYFSPSSESLSETHASSSATHPSNAEKNELDALPIEKEEWHYKDIQKEKKKQRGRFGLSKDQGNGVGNTGGKGPNKDTTNPSGSSSLPKRKSKKSASSSYSFWSNLLSWFGGQEDNNEDDLETYLILALCIVVGYLIYLRQLHFNGQAAPANNNNDNNNNNNNNNLNRNRNAGRNNVPPLANPNPLLPGGPPNPPLDPMVM